jgi:hypothetical protein
MIEMETTNSYRERAYRTALALVVALGAALPATAQVPAGTAADAKPAAAAAAGKAPAEAGTAAAVGAAPTAPAGLAQLGWLAGCWSGEVTDRAFREHWLPLEGGVLLGVSHTLAGGKSVGFEYLRLESRGADVFYVNSTPGQKEVAFKLVEVAPVEDGAIEFRFTNRDVAFPDRLAYRKAAEGWLYASVAGKVDGADRHLVYPMRRVDCETGTLITK